MRLRSKRLELSRDVIRTIRDLCKLIFNISSDAQLESIFGVSGKQMDNAIQRIINALPDRLFDPANRRKLQEVKTICAREYIFFQVQEKDSKEYKEDLENFVKVFSRDIEKRI